MNRRFSPQELFDLRNRIPIEILIDKNLKWPSKVQDGYFRFLCPLCRGFQTSVNPKTNLARCFFCQVNLNTIDLVMIVKGTRFVESVKYLQGLLLNGPSHDAEAVLELEERVGNIGG